VTTQQHEPESCVRRPFPHPHPSDVVQHRLSLVTHALSQPCLPSPHPPPPVPHRVQTPPTPPVPGAPSSKAVAQRRHRERERALRSQHVHNSVQPSLPSRRSLSSTHIIQCRRRERQHTTTEQHEPESYGRPPFPHPHASDVVRRRLSLAAVRLSSPPSRCSSTPPQSSPLSKRVLGRRKRREKVRALRSGQPGYAPCLLPPHLSGSDVTSLQIPLATMKTDKTSLATHHHAPHPLNNHHHTENRADEESMGIDSHL
jgi:hypothetical protein